MSAFAVANLREITMGQPIVDYLERIDATLAPFGGRFVIHGGLYERLEGHWTGDLIAIEFPDRAHALDWYHSPAYQAILPLRTQNSVGEAILIDAVPPDHLATDVLA